MSDMSGGSSGEWVGMRCEGAIGGSLDVERGAATRRRRATEARATGRVSRAAMAWNGWDTWVMARAATMDGWVRA